VDDPRRIPPRFPYRRGGAYEDRFPRYAANAFREAEFAIAAAERWERGVRYYRQAAANAERHGDPAACVFYGEMASAAEDAAEALRDLAKAAEDVQAHYRTPAGTADGE
jgi:predicted NBD/HSP70 family sugar kinase